MTEKIYPKTKKSAGLSRKIKIAAVLSFVTLGAVFAAGVFSPNVNGSTVGEKRVVSGSELFENNCARCHGSDGKGGKGPNLASAKRQAKWKDSDEKLVKKITNGGMFMPSFGKKLKPEEIKAIADHVRTLKE